MFGLKFKKDTKSLSYNENDLYKSNILNTSDTVNNWVSKVLFNLYLIVTNFIVAYIFLILDNNNWNTIK